MPATVIWDTQIGSAIDRGVVGTTIFRGGVVTGIDTANPSVALCRAYEAITREAAIGSRHPRYPNNWLLTMRRVRITPLANDQVRFQAIYSNEWDGPIVAYFITDDTSLTQYTGNRIPGTNIWPMLSWTGKQDTDVVPEDYINMSLMRPMRVIRIYGLGLGTPKRAKRDAVRCVNMRPWQDLPAAYWLCTRHVTDRSVYQGYYRYESVLTSKIDEDWREFAVLKNHYTGKYVPVEDAVLRDAAGRDYDRNAPSVYYPGGSYTNTIKGREVGEGGICVIFPYPMIDYKSIFGASDNSELVHISGDTGNTPLTTI